MDRIFEKIIEDKSEDEIYRMVVNLNKFRLNQKKHIKKYNKIRKLHAEILDSMEKYYLDGKYNIIENYDMIYDDIDRELPELDFDLDSDDIDDRTVLNDLFIYKNHPKLKSITEIYLEKNKFKNSEKVKMLNSMKNSYVSLFKVVDTDFENGYVTYEDVFTNKKYKIIDMAMSGTLKIDENRMVYYYNRIITFDDVSFGTGIHCVMTSEHKPLQEFLKKYKQKNISDFSKCVSLYNISKKDNDVTVQYNNQYGYRRECK